MQREKSNCSNDKPEAARACKTIPENHFKSDREAAVWGEGKARSRPLASCQNSLQEARVSPGAWWLEGWSRLPSKGCWGQHRGQSPFWLLLPLSSLSSCASSTFPQWHPYMGGGLPSEGQSNMTGGNFSIMRDQIWGYHQTVLGWFPFWIYREESCSLNICLPRDRMGEHASVEFLSGSELSATTLWPLCFQSEWYSGSASFSPSLAWLASYQLYPRHVSHAHIPLLEKTGGP